MEVKGEIKMQSRKITVKEENNKIILIIPKGEGPNQYNRRKEFDTIGQAKAYLKQQRLEGDLNTVQKVYCEEHEGMGKK